MLLKSSIPLRVGGIYRVSIKEGGGDLKKTCDLYLKAGERQEGRKIGPHFKTVSKETIATNQHSDLIGCYGKPI